MPSYIESFGISCVEAMSFGNAVICNNIGGLKEIVENGVNGELVNIGEIDELSNKILKLMNNQHLINMYAENNIGRSKEFTEERMIKEIYDVYRNI
nr:glycosyltransferase family 4 protein [Aminipila terrae]